MWNGHGVREADYGISGAISGSFELWYVACGSLLACTLLQKRLQSEPLRVASVLALEARDPA
jgi:hypothetical protein